MELDDRPVVIVGGGSAGIFIADDLAARGVRCVVIDQDPAAAFSSTRNQGWLQSGSLYAILEDRDAAIACREGAAKIREECPEAIQDDVESYYLFESRAQLDDAVQRCAALNVPITPLSAPEFNQMRSNNQLLGDTRLRFAAATSDRPVNTKTLLERISARAAANGAKFVRVSCSHVITLSRNDIGWRISLGEGKNLTSATVIAACGPYLPNLLQHVAPELSRSIKVSKIPVLVITSTEQASVLSKAMFITPKAKLGPNIVPFLSAAGQGISICLNKADVICDERNAFDDDLPDRYLYRHELNLADWYPGLIDVATNFALRAHFYVCQKLKSSSRGRFLETIVESLPNGNGDRLLVAVYPGKFTAAPIVAEECGDLIVSRWSGLASPALSQMAPEIATQRYYDVPEYSLVQHEMGLTFESL